MGTRSFSFAEGEFYHVYNRGVDKRNIFNTSEDFKIFLERLYVANSSNSVDIRSIKRNHHSVYEWDRGELQVAIGAYCLMPNHFHLLLIPLKEDGMTIFMNKLLTSYSMYFNARNQRTGALFEGRFKAKWAGEDRYLKYLYSYIHLNPTKLAQPIHKLPEDIYNYISKYDYSSLNYYQGTMRDEYKLLSPQHFPKYFNSASSHKEELFEWLNFSADEGSPFVS